MNPHYPPVAARANFKCEYCCAPQGEFNLEFEVEHIIPRSVGGADSMDNFALSCRSCNIHKGNFTAAGETLRLYNPRSDRWSEHFSVNLETGEIIRATPTGLLTILKLRMNGDVQTRARLAWIKHGVYSVNYF